jgi:hypothetical protein
VLTASHDEQDDDEDGDDEGDDPEDLHPARGSCGRFHATQFTRHYV